METQPVSLLLGPEFPDVAVCRRCNGTGREWCEFSMEWDACDSTCEACGGTYWMPCPDCK